MDTGGLITFGAGTVAGVIAMLPAGIVLWRAGSTARNDRRIEREKRKLAELSCGDAQSRATRFANERNAATADLTDALATIRRLEPLAAIGRARKAAIDAGSAKKRADRAGRK